MLQLIEETKPFKVRASCGHIVIRKMREATAGCLFTPEVILDAPNGRACDECEEASKLPARPADLIRIAVPRLNKNDTIAEYLEQIPKGDYDLNWARVTETKTLTVAEWNEFVTSLLTDRDWLSGRGGCNSWAFDGESADSEVDREFFKLSAEEQKLWRKTSYLLVIAVVAPTGQTIYVDPEGYNYARYVAFAADDARLILYPSKTREELAQERAKAEQDKRLAELAQRIANPPAVPTDHGLRFLWNGIKVNGGPLHKCSYSLGNLVHYPDATITVYSRDRTAYRFPGPIARWFHVENESDMQTDYFEDDRIRVCPNHPLYALVKSAYDAQEQHHARRMEKINARLQRKG